MFLCYSIFFRTHVYMFIYSGVLHLACTFVKEAAFYVMLFILNNGDTYTHWQPIIVKIVIFFFYRKRSLTNLYMV